MQGGIQGNMNSKFCKLTLFKSLVDNLYELKFDQSNTTNETVSSLILAKCTLHYTEQKKEQ